MRRCQWMLTMRRSGSWPAAIVVIAVLALPLAGSARGRQPAAPTTGLQAIAFGVRPPDFRFDVGSGSTTLSANYGRPIVINFWATWCDPCRDELPVFENLERRYAENTTLVTISAEDEGVARAFLKKQGIDLPVAEDPLRKVFDAYSIGPIPVTIVLDPNGAVSHVAVGELDWNELKAAVDASLALKGEAPPKRIQAAQP